MAILRDGLLLCTLPGLLFPAPTTYAGTVLIPGIGGGAYQVAVKSVEERRFAGVVKQEHDFSCGSAALATLLRYHYNRSATEKAVFAKMYEAGKKKRIRKEGFSLLDMKYYLKAVGFHADGYRLSLDRMRELGIPFVALINTGGYLHFVVVKGIDGRRVLIGDPAVGIRSMSRSQFKKKWNGIAFLIGNRFKQGRRHFNAPDEWHNVTEAPLAQGKEWASLGPHHLATPLPAEF